MRRRDLLGATAGSLPLVLGAGCAGADGPAADDGTDGTPTDGSSGTTVELVSSAFDPLEVSVAVGGTVTWANRDDYGHDVTSERFSAGAADWSFSATVPAGGSTTHTFEAAGVYEYYCTIHGESTMCGAVVVGEASRDGTLPCESGGGGSGGDGDDDDGGGDGGGTGYDY